MSLFLSGWPSYTARYLWENARHAIKSDVMEFQSSQWTLPTLATDKYTQSAQHTINISIHSNYIHFALNFSFIRRFDANEWKQHVTDCIGANSLFFVFGAVSDGCCCYCIDAPISQRTQNGARFRITTRTASSGQHTPPSLNINIRRSCSHFFRMLSMKHTSECFYLRRKTTYSVDLILLFSRTPLRYMIYLTH